MNESDLKECLQVAAREREATFSESLHARVMESIRTEIQAQPRQLSFFTRPYRLTVAAVLLLVLGLAGWNLHQLPTTPTEVSTPQSSVATQGNPASLFVEQVCPWKSTVETTAEIAGVTETFPLASFHREQLPIPSREALESVWQESADLCSMPMSWLLE